MISTLIKLPRGIRMKSILLSLLLAVTVQVNAAQVEMGKYKAIDVDTRTVDATFILRADGTVNFNVTTPDFTMPAPGCDGKYTVVGNEFTADMTCPTDLLPEVSVKIDITNVNSDSIRTEEGAEVAVIIDALGDEPTMFLLKKND